MLRSFIAEKTRKFVEHSKCENSDDKKEWKEEKRN